MSRRSLIVVSAALGSAAMLGLGSLDGPLRTGAAPGGIVSFELAGSASRAREILDSWGPDGRVAAGLSLGIDYLFLVAYGGFLLFAGLAVSDRLRGSAPRLARSLHRLSLAAPAASALDAVENFALIRLLTGSLSDHWARLAFGCALAKFAIALAAVAALVAGVVTLRVQRRRLVRDPRAG